MFWGSPLRYKSLKLGCPVWGSSPLLLREKLRVVSSLPILGLHAKGVVYGKILSQPLLPVLMWVFPPLSDVEESLS